MIANRKALVLLSGGQDSSTCLFWTIKQFEKVWAIGFDYGQRHQSELNAASKIAAIAKVPFSIFQIDLLKGVSENALTNSEIEIDNSIVKDRPPNTLVEGRNLLFITYSSIYAKHIRANNLVMGVGQTDYSGYPDCRDEFIQSAKESINLAFDYNLIIHTPLMWKNKAQTWKMADELGIFDLIRTQTVTCYNGIIGDGCGNCPACKLRQDGLQEYLSEKGHIKS
jgi:7-cyano-7-deazaguanine synthase